MYSEKMVVCVKTKDGKVLREKDGKVYVPFGTDYKLSFKNLENRKAVVKVFIDGEDVLSGDELLINPDQTIKLEGYLKEKIVSNYFRFIEKTHQISDFRGDKIDDGIIKISWKFEEEKQHINYPWYPSITYTNYPPVLWTTYNTGTPKFNDTQIMCSRGINTNNDIISSYCVQNDLNYELGAGITVKGETTEQNFKNAYVGNLESTIHTMCLQMVGFKEDNKKIDKPLLVKDKLQCISCGKVSKSSAKFCSDCGTFLECV